MAATNSDGANDGFMSAANQYDIPLYDVNRDAGTIPMYTRDHLQRLSIAVNNRIRALDEHAGNYPETLRQTRRTHKCLTAMLIILGLLWLATSIVILVAIFKDGDFDSKPK